MEKPMRTIGAIAAVSMLALTFSGASTPASAGNGGAVAAGVIGGLAVGAIIGSQAAAPRSYYGGPGYVEPVYGPPPRCWIERRDFVDPYGNLRVRNVRVCN
jgi:hypothetical protein